MQPDDYRALVEALAGEVRAEMGRRGISSPNELAGLAGIKRTAMHDRLYKNSRTGRKTPMTIPDLIAIANALSVDPSELLRRAQAEVDKQNPAPPDATADAIVERARAGARDARKAKVSKPTGRGRRRA